MADVFAPFPYARPRRLRRAPWIRDMVRETSVTAADLIWPLFVREGENVEEPVASMPGVSRLSIDKAVEAAERAADVGIPCVALFPNTPKDLLSETCEEAWNPENLVNRATRAIKAAVPEIGVMLD
ncbi:MAG: porphobilinogen synthase, partial [Pseudomonadota bacterium]